MVKVVSSSIIDNFEYTNIKNLFDGFAIIMLSVLEFAYLIL